MTRLAQVSLTDLRNYRSAELTLEPGLTAVIGGNGEGKTNLLEGLGYLATLSSLRGAPTEALVRMGAERAIVRAEADDDGRALLLECEIRRGRGPIVQVNRQRLKRTRDLLGVLRVTAFTPDDLDLVKGGPARRRGYLDEALGALHARHGAAQGEFERVLKQRNALLRQCGGRLDADAATTLDVWNEKLVGIGTAVADARCELLTGLAPRIAASYGRLSGRPIEVHAVYEAPWAAEGLAGALEAAHRDDIRRGVTTVGPHRDELDLRLDGRPSRTHASQGEQRTLALALRLAAHEHAIHVTGAVPVLLLDDVFSELDPSRCAALVHELPPGQAVLTTAGALPPGAAPQATYRIQAGTIERVG